MSKRHGNRPFNANNDRKETTFRFDLLKATGDRKMILSLLTPTQTFARMVQEVCKKNNLNPYRFAAHMLYQSVAKRSAEMLDEFPDLTVPQIIAQATSEQIPGFRQTFGDEYDVVKPVKPAAEAPAENQA